MHNEAGPHTIPSGARVVLVCRKARCIGQAQSVNATLHSSAEFIYTQEKEGFMSQPDSVLGNSYIVDVVAWLSCSRFWHTQESLSSRM
jgi:hypothetical protein